MFGLALKKKSGEMRLRWDVGGRRDDDNEEGRKILVYSTYIMMMSRAHHRHCPRDSTVH